MKTTTSGLLILIFSACLAIPARAGDPQPATFLIRFDSKITSTTPDAFISTRVVANYLVDPIEGELGHYRGYGRLRYIELGGLAAFGTDGGFSVNDMQVSADDGTVVLKYYPGHPLPNEWIVFPPAPPVSLVQWFGVFGFFHTDEFGVGGFALADWEYPPEETIYARKTYNRQTTVEAAVHDEFTTIELIPVVDPPRIDKINIESTGVSADDPETGKDVKLWADLHVPFPFEVQRCTWTGNNFTQPGTGDPEDNCRWSYKPRKGAGPERDTYGDKDITLTVVYRFGTDDAAIEQNKSKQYKVFFGKKTDDNSNSKPNWFDYWGDDGAVVGMDGPDVDYKASLSAIAEADGSKVFLGPKAAESDGPITIPGNDICAGGTFPGAEGIDLAAISLAHERKHNQLDALGGTDTDGDDVPDSAEAGTSASNPDSCNLAGNIHADYSTYGDHEYLARRAELGVMGVPGNDWGVPGRQATQQSLTSLQSRPASGFVATPTIAARSQTGNSLATPQGTGGALTGVYSSQGVDTDSDGLFNTLLLDVGVNLAEPGGYSVTAWLADDLGEEVVWAATDADLPAGDSTLQLEFDGTLINRIGAVQALQVARVELQEAVGKHAVLRDTALDVHTTLYDSADFDPPAATLAAVLSELPIDSGTDGLYDSLDLTVELMVNDPGEYEISARLNGTSMSLPASSSAVFDVAESTEQLTLSFDGSSLFFHRENGPWQIQWLRLTNVSDDSELDFMETAWTSAAYSFSEFQQSGIVIDETSYADAPGVAGEGGKFTTLDIMFNISSITPGPYEIRASLEDENGGTIAKASQPMGLGGVEGGAEIAPAMLSFDGADISSSGVDGPYQLADVTVISDEGIVMDQNPTPYMTAVYAADDFVTGDPGPGEEVIFMHGFEDDSTPPP